MPMLALVFNPMFAVRDTPVIGLLFVSLVITAKDSVIPFLIM